MSGPEIVAGATNTVVYVKSPGEAGKKIQNIVTLKFNELATAYFRTSFAAEVKVEIESWAESDPLSSPAQKQFQTLSVNYDTVAGAKYDARAYVLLGEAEQVKITVEAITITGHSGWDPTPLLVLENEMRVMRYYNLR